MKWNAGFSTDTGRKRAQNQDAGGVFSELGLFVLADGMGGHQGGERASQLAVESIHQHIATQTPTSPAGRTAENLGTAIHMANHLIYAESQRDVKLKGMGTTTTSLLIHENELTIGHVGDSRCYLLRPGAIWQLTRDHSWVAEKIRAGLITREQAKKDTMKNVITRCVGFESEVKVDLYGLEPRPGDVYLLCSDGLSGLVDDTQILTLVEQNLFEKKDIDLATQALIHQANQNGGDDNITAILIQIVPS